MWKNSGVSLSETCECDPPSFGEQSAANVGHGAELSEPLPEREKRMLLEIAIGDAYGAGFEYVNAAIIREHNALSGTIQHPRHGTKPGQYTDDT